WYIGPNQRPIHANRSFQRVLRPQLSMPRGQYVRCRNALGSTSTHAAIYPSGSARMVSAATDHRVRSPALVTAAAAWYTLRPRRLASATTLRSPSSGISLQSFDSYTLPNA